MAGVGKPDELLELAEWAYEGELLDEYAFAVLADMPEHAGRVGDLRTMEALERRTGEHLRGLLVDLGGDPAAVEERHRAMRPQIEAVRDMPIEGFFTAAAAGVPDSLRRYRRLRELVDERHHALMDDVIRHEEALCAFAERSRDGEPDAAAAARALLDSHTKEGT